MTITIRLPALTGAVLTLLSACGGAGGSDNTPALPVPAPVPLPSTPSPTPSTGPKDYQLAYLSPSQGIVTVPSNTLSVGTVRSSAKPLLAVQIYDGEWSNGVAVNNRPYSLVFLDGNAWKLLSLRSNGVQSVTNTGITDTRMVCTDFGIFAIQDYAAPDNSIVTYTTAGADNSCGTTDDLYSAFTLGRGGLVDLGSYPVLRQFRNASGGITGYLAQVGSEIRLYTPGASTFTSVRTGLVGRLRTAASFARTTTSAWMRWDDGTVKAIYRIDADGTVSTALYSVPSNHTLGSGYADNDAMFVSHASSSSTGTDIVRVAYDGSSSVIANVASFAGIYDETRSTLMIGTINASDAAVTDFSILPKTGGSAVAVASSGNDRDGFSPSVFTTNNDQYLLNTYSGTGGSLSSTALLVNAQAQVVERLASSEWIGGVGSDDNLAQRYTGTLSKAARIESYAGPYASAGHRGGTITVRDFNANTRATVAQVSASGYLSADLFGVPAGLATFDLADGSDTDLFGYDLDSLKFTQITNTPTVRETIP